MKFKRLVPLALALRYRIHPPLQKLHVCRRTAFVRRASELHADGQPSFCEQALTEHRCEQQLRRAGGLSGKRRACQAGTARTDRQHRGAAGGADPRRRTAKPAFCNIRPSGASCFTALTEAGVSLRACRREHRLWPEHTGGCCPVVDELVRPPREHSQQQLHHHRHRLYCCERNRVLGAVFTRINAKQTAFAVC